MKELRAIWADPVGQIVLLLGVGLGVVATLGLLKVVTGSTSAAWVGALGGVAAALATVRLAVLTQAYVQATQALVRQQTDPCVIVFVRKHPSKETLFDLVIKNIGTGLEKDITFVLPSGFKGQLWGVDASSVSGGKVFERGPLMTGVPALGPGEERSILWGQWAGIDGYLLNIESCRIKARFCSTEDQRTFETDNPIDISSFDGLDAAADDHMEKIITVFKELVSEIRLVSTKLSKSINQPSSDGSALSAPLR